MVKQPRTVENNMDFQKERAFVITSDMDWASEHIIGEAFDIYNSLDLPVTPFITNASETIRRLYRHDTQHVGLHPNFMPDSTHGKTFNEVIDHVINLWPQARCFRSHRVFEVSFITNEFKRRGFKYDSNLFTYMQPYITPMLHASQLIRFPVFWGDGLHVNTIAEMKRNLDLPGLKIFNFHPIHVTSRKETRQILEDVVDYVRENGNQFEYLDDLYESIPKPLYPLQP